MKDRLLTTEEIAEYLAKPAAWLHQRGADVGIPRYKLGREWRYDLEEVKVWLKQNREAVKPGRWPR